MRRMSLQPTVAEPGEPGGSGKRTAPPATLRDRSTSYAVREIRKPLIAITLLALAVHFLYFIHFHNIYAPDSSSYMTPASNLIHGQGFTGGDGRPETARTPGYPLLIALFLAAGGGAKSLVFFQHLMLAGLTAATIIVAFRLSGSRRQAIIAGIVLVIDLPILEAANYVLTEAFFTVVLAIALWLLWTASRQTEGSSAIRLLLSGILAGGSVLIRPVAMYFFVPAAAYLMLGRRPFKLRFVVTFLTAFAVLPLLWAARNHHETGYFTVTSISGRELLCWRAAGVLALSDPGDFHDNMQKHCIQLEKTVCDDLQRAYGKDCSQFSAEEHSAYSLRLGRKILLEHPVGSVRLAVRGVIVMFLDGGPASLQGITGINLHLGLRLLFIYTVPAFCFAILGLLRLWRHDRRLFYFLFLSIGYFVIVSAGGDTYSRHRVPIMPMYAILIASGIDAIFKSGKSRG